MLFRSADAKVLVVGWGGTYGHIYSAMEEVIESGKKVAFAHFNYINPLPKNTEEVLRSYDKVLVVEINNGQFASYLRGKVPGVEILQCNQMKAQPFNVSDIVEAINKITEE